MSLPSCITLRTVKGSVLSWAELDNNFICLNNSIENLSNSLLKNGNMWHIPSGYTLTLESDYQHFIYGDMVVEGLIQLSGDSQLVVLNGDLIFSGGSVVGTGTVYNIQLPDFDTKISGLTYNNDILTIYQNDGTSYSATVVTSTDVTVTGGTYDPVTGIATFYNNVGGNFPVTGFLTGYTDVQVNDLDFVGNTLVLSQTNGTTFSANTPMFSGNTSGDCITDLFVKNLNSCSPLRIQNVSSGDVYIGENGGVNVGIGTSTPDSKLVIKGSDSSSGFGLKVQNSGGTDNLVVKNDGYVRIGTTTGVRAEFDINANGGSGLYKFIGGNGNWGININPYDYISSTPIISSVNNGISIGSKLWIEQEPQIITRNTDFNWDIYGTSSWNIRYYGTTNKLFTVKNDGNVGIGTSTPDSKLVIKGNDFSSSSYSLKIQDSGGTSNFIVSNLGSVGVGNTSSTNGIMANRGLHIQNNTSSYLTIGNTNTSKSIMFGVEDGNFNYQLVSGGGYLHYGDGWNGSSVYTKYDTSNGNWLFSSKNLGGVANVNVRNTDAKVTIVGYGTDSSGNALVVNNVTTGVTNTESPLLVVRNDGNVGIGTSTPTSKLHLVGNNSSNGSYIRATQRTIGVGTISAYQNLTDPVYSGYTRIDGVGTYFSNDLTYGETITSSGFTLSIYQIINNTLMYVNLNTGATFNNQPYTLQGNSRLEVGNNYFNVGNGNLIAYDDGNNLKLTTGSLFYNRYRNLSIGPENGDYITMSYSSISYRTNLSTSVLLGGGNSSVGVGPTVVIGDGAWNDGNGSLGLKHIALQANGGTGISMYAIGLQDGVFDQTMRFLHNPTQFGYPYYAYGKSQNNAYSIGIGTNISTTHRVSISDGLKLISTPFNETILDIKQTTSVSIDSSMASSPLINAYSANTIYGLRTVLNGTNIATNLNVGETITASGVTLTVSEKVDSNTLYTTYNSLAQFTGYSYTLQGLSRFNVLNNGNVGIGTSTPSETLEVNGKTKTTNFQMTSGATTAGYVLTDSDGSGNAQWRPVSGITGVGNVFKYTTNLTFTDNETKTVTHNLNTKFTHCSVWDYSTDELVTAQVLRNGVNAVNITIATAGNYDILITG